MQEANEKFILLRKKLKARSELNSIRKWFSANDWKFNKVFIGEWKTDDPRWQEYLEERAIKRARQDELLLIIEEE